MEYNIDGRNWKPMEYTPTIDRDFIKSVLKWDTTETLLYGRRQSNPENSRHIWSVQLPNKLSNGTHKIQVRTTNSDGKVYTAEKEFKVADLKVIE